MGQKLVGALPPFWEEELGPHLTQSRLGRLIFLRPLSYIMLSWVPYTLRQSLPRDGAIVPCAVLASSPVCVLRS